MSTTSVLNSLGLRYDTPTFEDLQCDTPTEVQAYCTSLQCYGHHRYGKGIKKKPTKDGSCADCGDALVYRRRKVLEGAAP